VFYKQDPIKLIDALSIKYLVDANVDFQPIFLRTPEELMQLHSPAYILSSKQSMDNLPVPFKAQMKIIANGRIGHDPVVIFTHQ